MATNDVQLTGGIRSNLLLLQQTSVKLERTQQRLATGNRINSALDGPVNFFAAKGLNRRADDLTQIKDAIGQAISTIKAADTGITSIEKLLEQAKGLITTAFGNLSDDANSVELRRSLATQFDSLLRQVDKLAQDSGYQGKNLLLGNGRRLDATSSSKSAVNALIGVSGATATNVVRADSYRFDVTGDGSISGDTGDIATTERLRGISNLSVTGFASTSNFNFDDISIRLQGGAGRDKSFTIVEGSATITQTFTQEEWEAAKAAGTVLHFSNAFASGTRVDFDVDFDSIEDVPDTAGVGTSVIEKLVDLRVTTENETGATVTRDGLAPLGQGKLSNGENAFAFDSGTARIKVDERQILQASSYAGAVSGAYGTGGAAFTGIAVSTLTDISIDETIRLTAVGSSFNYATNNFETISIDAQGANATILSLSAGAATTQMSLTGLGFNSGAEYQLDVSYGELKYLAVAAAADATEIESTETATGTNLSTGTGTVLSVAGFIDNAVTMVNIGVSGSAGAANLVLSDGLGGTARASVDLTGGATSVTFTITGGANSGATFSLSLDSVAPDVALDGTLAYSVRGSFTGREARFDVRAANAGASATLETAQLVDGTDANDMLVAFNETNTSQIIVVSQNVQTDGLGLAIDFAQNSWRDRSDIDHALAAIDGAKTRLRGAATALNNGLDIISTRLDYTNEFVNVLAEGANKLVQADQNEEGANLLQLQTRQQLGTISLSLANQAQQAILRLF